MYISLSTKTMDRYPGLLQFTRLLSFSCLPRVVTRSPAALTVPVVYSSHDQVPSTPCVIFIADHVIVYHVLLSATPTRPKSGKRVQCALHSWYRAEFIPPPRPPGYSNTTNGPFLPFMMHAHTMTWTEDWANFGTQQLS